MKDRPNKRALTEALDVFRDAMRPFIVRNLKKVPGAKPTELVQATLKGERLANFLSDIGSRRSLEESIDIGDFLPIVKRYWREVFHDAFGANKSIYSRLEEIAHSRVQVAHPSFEDIHEGYLLDRLNDISHLLGEMNAPEERQYVIQIVEKVKPFSTVAHRIVQGGRDVYTFTLDIETLDRVLPERVDDDLVREANRPLSTPHAKKIQEYLLKRDSWILGTMLLGVNPDSVEFAPFKTRDGEDASVGTLTLRDTGSNSIKMFDGQHRRRAIQDLLRELNQTQRQRPRLNTLAKSSLPVMLYCEGSLDALRQMFADAAQTRRIEQNALARFDLSLAFNRAALWVAENSALFDGRVEFEKPSVSRTNEHIIAINQLAATLRCMKVGNSGRISNLRNQELMDNLDDLYEECLIWADDFMPAAREEYEALIGGEIDSEDIPNYRQETMAFNATVIRILAGTYFEWTRAGKNWGDLAAFMRGASLGVGKKGPSILQEAGIVAPGGTSPLAARPQVESGIRYILDETSRSLNVQNIQQ